MNISIPEFVQVIVDELSNDRFTNSIWIIGSRANGYASENSDWDILYFSGNEPTPRKQCDSRVDVIHIGPSSRGLVNGKSIEFIFPFENWEWNDIDNKAATYVGIKFIEYPDGVRDSTAPVYESRENHAYCLWRRV